MLGDNIGIAHTYYFEHRNGELVKIAKTPPTGIFPLNYIAQYLRFKFRKYFDKNQIVRGLLKLKYPCSTCGFEKCICKSIKLPKDYIVTVYEVNNLLIANQGGEIPTFLRDRTIIKRVSSRNKDATMFHVVAINNEPDFSSWKSKAIKHVGATCTK